MNAESESPQICPEGKLADLLHQEPIVSPLLQMQSFRIAKQQAVQRRGNRPRIRNVGMRSHVGALVHMYA
eukprot:115227-Amphidinium_carterae.1